MLEAGEQAVDALINCLKHGHDYSRSNEDQWIRQAAADTLSQIKGTKTLTTLIKVLDDKSHKERKLAIVALGKLGDTRALEPLVVALKDGDQQVRQCAAEALDKLGWQPEDMNYSVHYWIAKGDWQKCREAGIAVVLPLLEAINTDSYHLSNDWECVVGILARIGGPGLEIMVKALQNNSPYVRKAAAQALGQIGDTRATEPLLALLNDKNESVRQDTVVALGQLMRFED